VETGAKMLGVSSSSRLLSSTPEEQTGQVRRWVLWKREVRVREFLTEGSENDRRADGHHMKRRSTTAHGSAAPDGVEVGLPTPLTTGVKKTPAIPMRTVRSRKTRLNAGAARPAISGETCPLGDLRSSGWRQVNAAYTRTDWAGVVVQHLHETRRSGRYRDVVHF